MEYQNARMRESSQRLNRPVWQMVSIMDMEGGKRCWHPVCPLVSHTRQHPHSECWPPPAVTPLQARRSDRPGDLTAVHCQLTDLLRFQDYYPEQLASMYMIVSEQASCFAAIT